MKTSTLSPLVATVLVAFGMSLFAAPPAFNSGSNGSHGAFNPTTSTNLQVPPDGIFHFTTVDIPNGVVVNFTRNALNTPIYILAQGDVVMHGTAQINLDGTGSQNPIRSSPGRGGPGGFDGGFSAVQGFPGGDGQGPGGGKQTGYRGGVFSTNAGSNSNVYGNSLLSPFIGGSGGAGSDDGYGGGGGGGAILIASNTRIAITPEAGYGSWGINSRGGNGDGLSGGGSGGGVRLVAPVVSGNGLIRVAGGASDSATRNGSDGRIRLDTTDRLAWRNLHFDIPSGKWSVGSQMYVFPQNNPRLDIVEAAGTTILVGTNAPVVVSLLPGSSTNQVIKVQATNFTNDVPITVSIVPENGASSQFNSLITLNSGSPPVGTVNVVIPIDTICHVNVWTR